MMEDGDFVRLRAIKKRIKDHYYHMGNVRSQREKDELRVSIMNLENKISGIASQINWRNYDFSECIFIDLDDRIQSINDGKVSFVEVSHIWLVFDFEGKRIRIDLNHDDFSVDFLDKVKPLVRSRDIA
jgi:hypothetical protein